MWISAAVQDVVSLVETIHLVAGSQQLTYQMLSLPF